VSHLQTWGGSYPTVRQAALRRSWRAMQGPIGHAGRAQSGSVLSAATTMSGGSGCTLKLGARLRSSILDRLEAMSRLPTVRLHRSTNVANLGSNCGGDIALAPAESPRAVGLEGDNTRTLVNPLPKSKLSCCAGKFVTPFRNSLRPVLVRRGRSAAAKKCEKIVEIRGAECSGG
jgi:hypothetical protein